MDLIHHRLDVDAEGVAVVTFDRPPVNAQNFAAREELTWLFDALSDRDDVRVVVLTAAGRMFSAGADIKERAGVGVEAGDYRRHNRLTRESFYAVTECAKPVIAAVNGGALGAGLALALSCDILVMADDAYVAMPEIDVGLAGGGRFLQRYFPRSKLRTMYFTGARVPAAELLRLGIVEACVPGDALLPTALELARTIAAKSPVAVRMAKGALNTIEGMGVRDGYRFEQDVTVALSHTEDAQEARRAFLEKRKPVFKGR
jgi:enoyl-CoA hydratase